MKEKLVKFGFWFITVLYFMVILPIAWVIQGLTTPIEIVWNLIKFKGDFEPEEYWEGFAYRSINAFNGWLDVIEDEEA